MKMLNSAGHLSDELLFLVEDRELTPPGTALALEHLAECTRCQERRLAIRAWLAGLGAPSAKPVPGGDAARKLLQARLASATDPHLSRASHWTGRETRPGLALSLASVAAVLAMAFTWLITHGTSLHFPRTMAEEIGSEPNRTITPGAARPAVLSELCRLNDDDLDPKVSPEKVHEVFRAYRIDERAAAHYQVDYLINPQLGGSDALQNLWPQPSSSTVWNAAAKDALETRLHTMVCDGELPLETAQHDISTDWIAAYKKYFHAALPVGTGSLAIADALPLEDVRSRSTEQTPAPGLE